jgi:hypothetical protein
VTFKKCNTSILKDIERPADFRFPFKILTGKDKNLLKHETYMRLRILQLFLVVLSAMVFPVCLWGQTLTIVSTGENGSGSVTNWSLSGSTLTVTGTANIRASVIENALLSGPLTVVGNSSTFTVTVSEAIAVASGGNSLAIGNASNTGAIAINSTISSNGAVSVYGGTVTVNQTLTTTASGASVLLQAKSYIILATSRTIQTNGGDIVLWSNAANITSGTANNEIVLAGTNTLSSSGGKIVLAGGLDNNADAIPDGFAYRGGYAGEAIDIRSDITLNSGGGQIIIRGQQNGSAEGIGTDATFTISNAGAISIEGKNTTAVSVRFGTSNITSTTANAPINILGTTHLLNAGLVTITSQGGDVLLASNIDDATDGESVTNGYIQFRSGLIITSNGGDIVLGGGNTSGSDYALGSSAEDYTEGVRIDVATNLNSGGGAVFIKGKSYNRAVRTSWGASGVGFYGVANGIINSGTGKIQIDGYSQTSTSDLAAGIVFFNSTPFTAESANSTSDAIIFNGFSSGTSGHVYGIETEGSSTLNLLATASGGGITINTGNSIANFYDAVFRGALNMLAVDGPISLKGGQLGGVANGTLYFADNVFLGSKASTSVTSSSSNILIGFDRYDFAAGLRYIGTSGTVTWQPNAASFGAAIATSWFSWNQNSQTIGGLTIGKVGNTAGLTVDSELTINGPISLYGNVIALNQNLTSTAQNAKILVQSTGTGASGTVNGYIHLANTRNITTNGGDIVLWSNASNIDNGTANNETWILGNNTLSTSGGKIVIAGGADTNADGIPDGYAYRYQDNNWAGVHFAQNGNTTLNSAGGDIIVRGKGQRTGIFSLNALTINSGSGTIYLEGVSNQLLGSNNAGVGVEIAGGAAITSANTTSSAITVIGDARNSLPLFAEGIVLNTAGNVELSATGSGGGITFTSLGGVNDPESFTTSRPTYLLANGGPINITVNRATAGGDLIVSGSLVIGRADANLTTNDVTSSSSNVTIDIGAGDYNWTNSSNFRVDVSGSLTFKHSATTFTPSKVSTPQTLSGLTIGDPNGNTGNVTIDVAQSIAGPISLYGGTVTLNENISSTAGGNITLAANTLTFASGKTVTSTGELHLYPTTSTNTIGVAGATGNLALPASYFTTNFTNGFSAIVLGHNTYTQGIAINAFTLSAPLRFQTSGSLTLNGALAMGSNDVSLNASLTLAGTGYFHTTGAGVVKRTIASAGSFTFPVRDDVTYDNTLVITNNSGTGDEFSVRVDGDVLANGTGGASITDKVVKATWHIGKTNANASPGVNLVFKWHTGQHLNVSDFVVSHYGTYWGPVSGALTPVVNSNERTLTLSGYTGSFSPFAIGSSTGALPVSWLDVSATRTGQSVQLNWSTASEQNTKDFVVQHSSGNGRWTNIGNVAAAGFSSSIRSYRFTHTQPLDGRNQYRLLQRDLDGRESLSKVVSLVMPSATSVQVYPVPSSTGSVYVKLPADQPLKLLNSQGVLVLEQTGKAGVQLLELPELPKGLYYLQAGKETIRVILQ